MAIAAAHFGNTSGSPDWDVIMAADINGNGTIDEDDWKWYSEVMVAK